MWSFTLGKGAIVSLLILCLAGCNLKGRGSRGGSQLVKRPAAPPAASSAKETSGGISGAQGGSAGEAESILERIKLREGVARGLLFELGVHMSNLESVPSEVRGNHYDLEAFRKVVRECWGESPQVNPEFIVESVDFKGPDPGQMSDEDCAGLVQTQTVLENAYKSTLRCSPPSIRAARRFPKGTPQSAFVYMNTTLERVNAVRILMGKTPEFVSETLSELGKANQRIAMLLMEVQTSKASEKEKQDKVAAINTILEYDMRSLEAQLMALNERVDEELMDYSDRLDDLLGTYPFLNLN